MTAKISFPEPVKPAMRTFPAAVGPTAVLISCLIALMRLQPTHSQRVALSSKLTDFSEMKNNHTGRKGWPSEGFFPLTNKVKMAQAVCFRNHPLSMGPTAQHPLHGTLENLTELQNGSSPKEFKTYMVCFRDSTFSPHHSLFLLHCSLYYLHSSEHAYGSKHKFIIIRDTG